VPTALRSQTSNAVFNIRTITFKSYRKWCVRELMETA